jgi:hypothetical protein
MPKNLSKSIQFSFYIFLQKDSYDQPRAEKYEENELPVQRKAPEELSASTKNVPLKSENPESRLFLFQILDLVDRYWNGSKSLHKNNKFKGMIAFVQCFIYRSLKFYLFTMKSCILKFKQFILIQIYGSRLEFIEKLKLYTVDSSIFCVMILK